jgi:putative membrane-bound dehydrogenase-like protein
MSVLTTSGLAARFLAVSLLGASVAAAGETRLNNGRTFALPDGFSIELIAGPPLVDRPIVADFDDEGRLYVADSSGSNDPVQKQLQEKPHRILRLEDTDGDGRFDRRTIFADKMMFPEGAMWLEGSLYVSAPPSIWKLTDTDGDGVADDRQEWFQGKTLTNCANDLHGPYRGPDGWVYWCKGAFAEQTYERPGKSAFVTRAAHIFRCRPDGSGIEPVMTGGMDNPVDVAFTPGGERIFTSTFLQHPEGGRRDGLIHAVYGGVYGKIHEVLDNQKRTSPDVMPVLSHLGPAAPCGLTRYESEVFGVEYRDNLFATLFNLHKVSRHILEPDGATFKSRDEDFLVSSDLDFHPTDLQEDADGSLVVIDTGGWYKLCCPTSQLHKPDVLGGIYRVRKTDAQRVEDPRGLKLDWAKLSVTQLASLLGDRRPAVRARAIQALARKPQEAFPAIVNILERGRVEERRNALWSLTRMSHPGARVLPILALQRERSESVRQVAIHAVGLWRDANAIPVLIPMLKGSSLSNRRAAAEALGRIGNKLAVPELLAAVKETSDRVLLHSLTFALIEIADPRGTAEGLKTADVATKRAVLMALDQMDGGALSPETITPYLVSSDPTLKETAVWIAGRHPEWGGALAGFLTERLTAKALSDAERVELQTQLARFARTPAIRDLLADRLRDASASPDVRKIVLSAMAQSGLKPVPDSWVEALVDVVSAQDRVLSSQAVATARSLPIAGPKAEALRAVLIHLANEGEPSADLRLGALAAVPGGPGALSPDLFAFARSQLSSENPVSRRALAADVLSRAKLSGEQLIALSEILRTVGPLELNRLLAAFEGSTDETVGLALVSSLRDAATLSTLRSESLKPRLAKFAGKVPKEAEELYAKLDVQLAQQKEKLESLLSSLSSGDIRRGQAVFNNPKVACVSCHAIGYLGGKVGPDLTRIGQVRSERDLLESLAFPSASFVRSYEPVIVATKDGKIYSGVLKKDAPDEVVLVTSATEEARIPRDDIEDMKPGSVSIMPEGLDQQLTPQELADLVAFLKATKY